MDKKNLKTGVEINPATMRHLTEKCDRDGILQATTHVFFNCHGGIAVIAIRWDLTSADVDGSVWNSDVLFIRAAA